MSIVQSFDQWIIRIKKIKYRWYILILAALTNAVAVAIPAMALSVLLPEISQELGLSLVQAGWVWGIYSLPAIFTGLIGGSLGDRFGPKRILTISCLVIAFLGALRGLTWNFYSLAVMSLLFGVLTPVITMNDLKTAGTWFPNKELGLASGIVAMGMAAGFMLGSAISATVLSPWLGGWRNVFLFYGVLTVVLVFPWRFSRTAPNESVKVPTHQNVLQAIVQDMLHVAGIRNIWLLGLAAMGINGAIQGLMGYLPLYLRSIGWSGSNADATLGVLYAASLACVLPIALGSDRLGTRKKILIAASLLIAAGFLVLSLAVGNAIWLAVILIGIVRDGFMAVILTTTIEIKGVGSNYAGTATGFVMIFIGVGNLLAPPFGNGFAEVSARSPFIFWAGLTLFGMICIFLTGKEAASGANYEGECCIAEPTL